MTEETIQLLLINLDQSCPVSKKIKLIFVQSFIDCGKWTLSMIYNKCQFSKNWQFVCRLNKTSPYLFSLRPFGLWNVKRFDTFGQRTFFGDITWCVNLKAPFVLIILLMDVTCTGLALFILRIYIFRWYCVIRSQDR